MQQYQDLASTQRLVTKALRDAELASSDSTLIYQDPSTGHFICVDTQMLARDAALNARSVVEEACCTLQRRCENEVAKLYAMECGYSSRHR